MDGTWAKWLRDHIDGWNVEENIMGLGADLALARLLGLL
jgi:hypothetical protein